MEINNQPASEWTATLGKIGPNRFFEIQPQRSKEKKEDSLTRSHLVRLRSFWKVSLDGDTLTLTSLSLQWDGQHDQAEQTEDQI
jgi:hypothetical protein